MRVITLAGSPRFPSRSSALLEYAREKLNALDVEVCHWNLHNFEPEDLLYARFDSPALKTLIEQLNGADGLIVATPIYKASFSGALKTLLDLLPERALDGKVVLPLATGGTVAHLLAVDYALKPVLNALKAQEILHGVFADDSQVIDYQHKPTLRLTCKPASIMLWKRSGMPCIAGISRPRRLVSLKESHMFKTLTRIGLAGLMALTSLAHAAETAPESLRIGYQKGSVSMVLAKSHQLLEKRFPDTKFSWVEFPAGPQMLEALNVGSIDLGSTGDIPPIFAQAAGADLLYVGVEPPKPKAEVILVPENSDIKSVADLKGHKVAFQKGSSSHNLLLRALQEAGLKFTDIQPVYLTPADARAAFQQKNVDAWAIWDPYYSAALLQGGVRVLKDGTTLKQTGSFYLAARPYAEKNGAFIQGVLDTFTQADALTQSQRQESIALLAKTMGLPEPVIASYLNHRPPTTITPVDAHVAALQQQTADLFYQNRLVPKQVTIRERIWQPAGKEGAKS